MAYLFLVRRMASTIEGGCLCGGVRYRLHVRPKQGSDCHCEDCRRASAAPYVTWCSVPSKAIEVLSGELRRVSYADRLRSFASCCGTPLFIQDEVERTISDYFAYPGVKEWWATRKHWLTDEFRTVVEAIITKNPEAKLYASYKLDAPPKA